MRAGARKDTHTGASANDDWGWGKLDVPGTLSQVIPTNQAPTAVATALRRNPLDAVYSSDLSRASETAAQIGAGHGVAVQLRPALREMHQGELEGMVFTDVLRDYPDLMRAWMEAPADVAMPGGGESLRQVQERAWPEFERIIATHERGRVAIVSHTMTLRTLLARVLGLTLDGCRRFHIDTASLTRVEVNGRLPGLVVRTLNATEHLHTGGEART